MIVNFLYVPNLSLLNGAIPANLEALFEHVGGVRVCECEKLRWEGEKQLARSIASK